MSVNGTFTDGPIDEPWDIEHGGTGGKTKEQARDNLEIPSRQDLIALQQIIDSLDQTSQQEDISNLQNSLTLLGQQVSSLNGTVTTQVQTINSLTTNYNAQASALTTLQTKVNKLFPISVIFAWPGTNAPEDALLCDGTQYSSTLYPELFAAIGNKYGGVAPNFKVPNIDIGETLVQSNLAGLGTSTVGQHISHNHGIDDPGHNHGVNDPGHTHDANYGNVGSFLVSIGGASGYSGGGDNNTASSGTGIWLNGSGTDITIQYSGGDKNYAAGLRTRFFIRAK